MLWFTEGKGDEDLSVHYFHRWSAVRLSELDLTQPQKFSTQLPASPLSYEGHILRIRWCLRLRLFLTSGKEIVTEQPIKVVPQARIDSGRRQPTNSDLLST